MKTSDNERVSASEQLVKDGAVRLVDVAHDLELLHWFEIAKVLRTGYSIHLDDAQHLVKHAEWCLRKAAWKIEQHYGGTVEYDEDCSYVWQDRIAHPTPCSQ